VGYYKERAGIKKHDGAHVLFRHSPASLMVQNGCDLLTIQQVMRHNHIITTMRYLHLADDVMRTKYERFLWLWCCKKRRSIANILRFDICTTLMYAHVADKTLRDRYNQCLTIGVWNISFPELPPDLLFSPLPRMAVKVFLHIPSIPVFLFYFLALYLLWP
jgi:hypothetical protein